MPRVSEPLQLYLAGEPVLREIMAGDLTFKGGSPPHPVHNLHAFAAKFPPQLPRVFIQQLTEPGDAVLDPMAGSGTAVIEAARLGRVGIAIDLDPLAVRMCKAKLTPLDTNLASSQAEAVLGEARRLLESGGPHYYRSVLDSFEPASRDFVAYWFLPETIAELGALVQAIRQLAHPYRLFFETLLSSIIVTKSGGVSLARDLAHSRPHRVAHKRVKNALEAFREKSQKAIPILEEVRQLAGPAYVFRGDSRRLPLSTNSVDLIVTSPPYANAIDYMRAHKFSLVWLGTSIGQLSELRGKYIGAERALLADQELLSPSAEKAVREIRERDPARAGIVYRYFVDMAATLKEMHRVLRPGRFAIIVVGSSTIRGVVVNTALALAEMGQRLGFRLLDVKEREIDRDRRLMPVSKQSQLKGIEARMHKEHVIALVKPV
jgi:DNA modification methylase